MPGSAFVHDLQTLQGQPAHLRRCIEQAPAARAHHDRVLCGPALSRQDRPEQPAGQCLTAGALLVSVSGLPTAVVCLCEPDRSGSSSSLSAFPACTRALPETARRGNTKVLDPGQKARDVLQATPHARTGRTKSVRCTRPKVSRTYGSGRISAGISGPRTPGSNLPTTAELSANTRYPLPGEPGLCLPHLQSRRENQ
jgi:hypothetical protein